MVEKSIFGTLADGTAIDLYKITNKSGAFVTLQTLGAGIQSINVPDKNGVLADVVLGFDNPQDYSTAADASVLHRGMLRKRAKTMLFSSVFHLTERTASAATSQ